MSELTSNQNPGARTPRVSEMDNEEPDHNDGGPTCCLVVVEVVDVLSKNDSNDQVRNAHANCADCEDGLAADTIDVQYSRDCMKLVELMLVSVYV